VPTVSVGTGDFGDLGDLGLCSSEGVRCPGQQWQCRFESCRGQKVFLHVNLSFDENVRNTQQSSNYLPCRQNPWKRLLGTKPAVN
jgi:hypothetical protein